MKNPGPAEYVREGLGAPARTCVHPRVSLRGRHDKPVPLFPERSTDRQEPALGFIACRSH
jgi:hypothetical protein